MSNSCSHLFIPYSYYAWFLSLHHVHLGMCLNRLLGFRPLKCLLRTFASHSNLTPPSVHGGSYATGRLVYQHFRARQIEYSVVQAFRIPLRENISSSDPVALNSENLRILGSEGIFKVIKILATQMWPLDQQAARASSGSLLEVQNLGSHPELLNHNLHFDKTPAEECTH